MASCNDLHPDNAGVFYSSNNWFCTFREITTRIPHITHDPRRSVCGFCSNAALDIVSPCLAIFYLFM